MAENGGPVYEGSANFTPKKTLGEKLKQKVSKEQLSQTANNVRERVKNRLAQNTGIIVEQKWMDAYQKTVDALDEGKRKDIAKKLKIVARGVAKVHRIGSAVVDVALRVGGLGKIAVGVPELVHPQSAIDTAQKYATEKWKDVDIPNIPSVLKDPIFQKLNKVSEYTPNQMRTEGALNIGTGLLEGALGKARISAVASGWMADIVGMGGEKIAQITNKIFRGKPTAEAATA
jgi:hypothetical protein